MKIEAIGIFMCIILLVSCKTTSDKITYFQDVDSKSLELLNKENLNYETKICPDDQLSIFVSSIDPKATAIFNLPMTSYLAEGKTEVNSTPSIQTYLVDNKGYIDFPVLGKISVAGLTRRELTNLLQEEIAVYAKSPLINIRILNFKISVIGEVNAPGTKVITNERVTILDAIGAAEDLSIYGERTNILLIRDNNGKKEFHRIDLTSSKLFMSPYFYLQQNDVIYVEPNKVRKGNAKYSQSDQFKVSVASTIVGGISVLASLVIALFVK